nr:hypothetical protein [Tanacetum cinerariifolium]
EAQIHAWVDGKEIIISQSYYRRDLQLADKEGVDCLPNSTIFENLELMGCQDTMGDIIAQTRFENVSKLSNDSLLARARVDSSKDEQTLGEDASKQGRKINDIDDDEDITLVNDQDDAKIFDVNDLHGKEVFVEKEVDDKEVNDEVQKVIKEVVEDTRTAKLIVDVIQVSATEIKTSKPKAKGIVLQEPSESTTTTTTTKTISLKQSQDKGKSIMVEEPVKLKKKDQIRLDEEAALVLQAELQADFDEEQILARERAQKEQEANIDLIETWDDVQAKINAYYQLAE